MTARRLSSVAVASTLTLALAAVSNADTAQPSPIAQMMVLEPGDASYKLFHGAIWLEHDKAQWNYRWGGLQCKGRELSDTSVRILFDAFRADYFVSVEYVATEHNGKPYRCVTGFTVTRK